MKILVNGIDLAPSNVDRRTVQFAPNDLSVQVGTATFIVDEEKQVTPQEPKVGLEVLIYDDDNTTLLFGGFIRNLRHIWQPVRRRWAVEAWDYNVRALDSQTDSLNKSGVIDSDRNFVIALFRAALKAVTFGVNTTGLDDPIITANEPNWPNVQTTVGSMSGVDWSYTTLDKAMTTLLKYVPNAYWRIGPNKLLTYGLLRTVAPFAVATNPVGAGMKPFENYEEEILVADHKNKMRRGGAAASVATAFDESSYAAFGRILEDPYKNDTTIPAADLTRRTYAELKTRRVRRIVRFTVRDKGLQAGQVVDVVNTRIGSGMRPAPLLDVGTLGGTFFGRSASGRIAGERARFLITKVTQRMTAGAQTYAWDVEAGDTVNTFVSSTA